MTPGRQVSIRPPLFTRVYVAVFAIGWLGVLSWITLIHRHGSSPIVGIVLVVFGVVLACRLLRLGVWADQDGSLIVHNNIGSRRLSRDEIEGFQIGTNGAGRIGQRGVQAVLRDGTACRLDVCRVPFGFGSQKLARQLDQLNAWLGA